MNYITITVLHLLVILHWWRWPGNSWIWWRRFAIFSSLEELKKKGQIRVRYWSFINYALTYYQSKIP